MLFDEVENNPSVATIRKAAAFALEKGVDFVIGIGGGLLKFSIGSALEFSLGSVALATLVGIILNLIIPARKN